MNNTKQTTQTTPARRRRFKTRTAFRQLAPAQTGIAHHPDKHTQHPANDLLVLCYYPGMKPEKHSAA